MRSNRIYMMDVVANDQTRKTLLEVWHSGVAAVGGHTAVTDALTGLNPHAPDQIIAVGKAAASMAQAALDCYGAQTPTLVVTKYGHGLPLPKTATMIEAAHPVPDENSIRAGQTLFQTVGAMPKDSHLLMLVSGGASALAEWPVGGMTLVDLARENSRMLSAGLDIHAMNAHRKTLSQIKGGKLLARFGGASVTTLAVSDVQGDDLAVIGSGIGAAPHGFGVSFQSRIVASNTVARNAAAMTARNMGHPVLSNDECLYGDVTELAPLLAQRFLSAGPGLHIFGGEPTVVLPARPGRGGRNQALALLLAREIAGTAGLTILVAGTDGSDGPTDAAGAIVDGTTWAAGGADALLRADSGAWLDQRGALLRTGPTSTNVMDLVIALRA
jgi:glycerate 2-kinase